MRGSVGIAASNRGARLSDSLLWSDDVNDALFTRAQVEISYPKVIAIFLECLHHFRRERILRGVLVDGGDDVIDRGKSAGRKFHLESEIAEHAEGLRRGHLVNQVRADE